MTMVIELVSSFVWHSRPDFDEATVTLVRVDENDRPIPNAKPRVLYIQRSPRAEDLQYAWRAGKLIRDGVITEEKASFSYGDFFADPLCEHIWRERDTMR